MVLMRLILINRFLFSQFAMSIAICGPHCVFRIGFMVQPDPIAVDAKHSFWSSVHTLVSKRQYIEKPIQKNGMNHLTLILPCEQKICLSACMHTILNSKKWNRPQVSLK